MNDSIFEVGAEGMDTVALVRDIRATVERKRAQGAYADARVARAERHNLLNLDNEEDFFGLYMACLREAFAVNINDFEIVERRPRFSRLIVALKRAIWALLKFYTYRLWSQQNQINGLMLSALEAAERVQRARIADLERRLAQAERRITPS